jgi:rfaE bifunctional protein nucleotidyltransferase chain/domain
VDEVFASAHAILVADYGRGTTDLPEIRQLLAERIAAGTPVVWDPHPHGPAPVAGCRVVTPNASEAASFFGAAEPVEEAAQFLRTRWEAGAVAVTCAGDGATLADGLRCQRIPVPDQPLSTVDSCGAGDCFAATVAGGLADGLPVIEAVAEAVRAATSFVAAGGAAALSIVDSAATDGMNELDIARLRRSGGRLVAAGGCFDLLHPGHVNLLRQARDLGDALIVCVNSDESVRRRKGPGRPILPVADRVRLLEALETVDAVAVFAQDTPTEVLDRLRPDIWVKGGDYVGQDLPEAEVVRRHGGDVVFVPLLDGYSTTRLARALQEAR